ncbi:MAG: UvrD-helicase domain-containing protein [Elusimicrobia bacterium]|nr:UvrD-helicase domain-containing protein [Elusimicrobiota bacterium]
MSLPYTPDLNPQQKQAAEHEGGPLLVVAGAGTGKTRVITHRIARLLESGVAPGRILAVTFTNKAAQEMRRRLSVLSPGSGQDVWIHTFHSLGCRFLRQHAPLLKLSRYFTIYDQDDQKKLVSSILKDAAFEPHKNKASLFVNLISRAKDDLLDADSYAIHAMTAQDPFRQTVAQVYKKYQERLDRAAALDFGDLLIKTVFLLRDYPAVRDYYQELFLHVLVDEYQDTNHSQYVLTKSLSSKHKNLCAVGDMDQSIYQWRGADIRNIMEFDRDFSDARIVALEENYRSTPNILEAANRVIVHNRYRKPKNLWTQKAAGAPVTVRELRDETEEAYAIVRAISQQLERGRSLREIAIFYRTNAQSRSFEEALSHAQIPYRIYGAIRFYERKEIKDALAYARVVLNPSDSVSLARILNAPSRGIGKTSQQALEKSAETKSMTLYEALCQENGVCAHLTPGAARAARELVGVIEGLRSELDALSAAQLMERILKRSGYWDALEQEAEEDPEQAARLGNLQELVNGVREFEERWTSKETPPSLGQYLENVSLMTPSDEYDDERACVTLMTIHLAKGLEFPAVYLTGLEEGLFPIGAGAASEEDLEEERRLCYVGMTRAKEELFLTYAATRRIFGQAYSNLPSRFILEAGFLDPAENRPRSRKPFPPPPGAKPSAGAYLEPVSAQAGGGPSGPPQFRIGKRVKHAEFGFGRVISKSGSGEAMKVTVFFDQGMAKKFLVRFANLEAA